MDGRGVPDFNKKPGEASRSRPAQPRISTGQSGKHLDASQGYKSTDEVDLDFIEDFDIGDTIGGTYFITSHLGRGGMGQVFGVEHIMLRQNYALKILTKDSPDNTNWRRFQTEARVIAKLNHPNIIKVHNLGIHNEKTPYYVMELLDGESLSSWVKREGPINPEAVIDLFIPLCDGLSYAHANGIIHRDIKPSNIMLVSQNGKIVPKLVDFGLVKLVGGALSPSQQLTNTGEVFGSPLYMSPEQSVGRHINERSDVYSLGCSMFEALTGAPPFVGENVVQTILKHQNEPPPTLKQASMGLEFSPEWEAVMARVLEKEASERYQSMAELAADLKAIKAGKKLRRSYATTGGELFGDEVEELAEEDLKTTGKRALFIAVPLLLFTVLVGLGGGYWYVQTHKAVKAEHVDSLGYSGVISDKKVLVGQSESKELEDISTPFALDDGHPNGVKTFKFPDSISLGNLYVENPGKERLVVEAIGTKTIPADSLVTFDAGRECGVHPKIFRKFRKEDLQAVILPSASTDTDDVLHFLNHLTNIGILNLGGTDVTVTGLKSVAELPKLFALSLVATNKLSGADLATLPTLGQLRNINFNKGREVTALLQALKGSQTLTDLSLNECALTAEDIKLISTMPNIERLSMNSCGLKSADLAPLSAIPALSNLTIRDNDFTPELIDALSGIKHLSWLQISPPKWSDEEISRLKTAYGPRLSLRGMERMDE